MRDRLLSCLLVLWALAGAGACSSEPSPHPHDEGEGGSTTSSTGAGGSGAGGSGAGGSGAGGEASGTCSEPVPIACSDEVILGLNAQKDPAPGLITNEPDGSGFRTTVDATGGGPSPKTPHSYVYGRFTETGLEKVEIGDEAALESMDWDIAFRRYIVRINSADSGPSCVTAARVPGDPGYDDFTSEPEGLKFRKDDYFTDSCAFIPDGSGLENSPATALSSYWEYPSCVAMTGHVFVVQLKDGRHLKLVVTSFYEDLQKQEECNTMGSIMATGGTIRLRWAFLP